ncbi:MAG: M23 family metallopeptidase [Fibrobacteraceae bacterium]|nr:M23 family metallopeptidase [Fibrobacteraceae bacterium]
MSMEWQEYQGKRRKKNYHTRKFPLVRLLMGAFLVWLCYYFGWFQIVVNKLIYSPEMEQELDFWTLKCVNTRGVMVKMDKGYARCSWVLDDVVADSLPQFPNAFLRYVASQKKEGGGVLHWVAPVEDFESAKFVQLSQDSVVNWFFHVQKKDSSWVWVTGKKGCNYPGPCPNLPIDRSALTISENFDFLGQDNLLSADVFSGLGEAPIYPVLPGVVLESGRDSVGYFVEIDHGNNVSSRTFGMGSLMTTLNVGDTIDGETPIGRIAPKDSASFYLKMQQNGLFIRWNDFYSSSYPISEKSFAIFKNQVESLF